MFGKGYFQGLFALIEERISKCAQMCVYVGELVTQIRRFLEATASGERLTLAQWMREYVNKHPSYTHNSILPKRVMDDLILHLHAISIGSVKDANF